MERPELKPCPFCGGEAIVVPGMFLVVNYKVICDHLKNECAVGPQTKWYTTPAEAAAAWNSRAGDQPQQKRRRDRRKCVHFRFPTAEIAHVWCAKYGSHYDCLGANGCPNYAESPVMQAENREG